MILKLYNLSKNKIVIFEKTKIAQSFLDRSIGLMGKSHLNKNECLFIKQCNWIHTFFMNFSIDVIYLSKNMIVKQIHFNIPPWRMGTPVFSSKHVIECLAGKSNSLNIKIGDELYVGN